MNDAPHHTRRRRKIISGSTRTIEKINKAEFLLHFTYNQPQIVKPKKVIEHMLWWINFI